MKFSLHGNQSAQPFVFMSSKPIAVCMATYLHSFFCILGNISMHIYAAWQPVYTDFCIHDNLQSSWYNWQPNIILLHSIAINLCNIIFIAASSFLQMSLWQPALNSFIFCFHGNGFHGNMTTIQSFWPVFYIDSNNLQGFFTPVSMATSPVQLYILFPWQPVLMAIWPHSNHSDQPST